MLGRHFWWALRGPLSSAHPSLSNNSSSYGFPLLLLPKAVSNQPAMLAPAPGGFKNKRQMCVMRPCPLHATDPNFPKVRPLHTSVLRRSRCEWKLTPESTREDTKHRSGRLITAVFMQGNGSCIWQCHLRGGMTFLFLPWSIQGQPDGYQPVRCQRLGKIATLSKTEKRKKEEESIN